MERKFEAAPGGVSTHPVIDQAEGADRPTPDLGAEWRREIAARVAALDAGEVETTPWEEVRGRLEARLSAHRADRVRS